MKNTYILLLIFTISLSTACKQGEKKEPQKEISIEKKKINDSLVTAKITTKITTGDKVSEEIREIEGTPEEINTELENYKKEVLHTQHAQDSSHENMPSKEVKKLQFALNPKSNSTAKGMVTFTEENGEVTIEVHINGLSPGTHAIHVHEKADCSSEDGKSSGGHWNPTFSSHGKWGDQSGYHRGDIGNFEADATGHGMITFSTSEWCLGCEDESKNLIGKAIIVHQGEDDLTSQPSGAAGARVSCAGIIE